MSHVRVVTISDTHGDHDRLEVPPGDLLIHAGDMTPLGTLPQLERVVEFFARQPHAEKIVIAGNHDWCFEREHQAADARARLERVATYLFDSAVTVFGLKIYGSPWQPWFCDWAFNVPRGPELAAIWSKIPADTDILITHGPPAGIGDRCFDGRQVGCTDLLARIEIVRPLMHVFGHIHEAHGVWQQDGTSSGLDHPPATTFVNASCDDFGLAPSQAPGGPLVFDIDTAAGTVSRVGQ